MMNNKILHTIIILLAAVSLFSQNNPCLILTKESVPELQEAISVYPLWKQNVNALKAEVDAAILNPIDVPKPVDPAGGYTHGQHKQNAQIINSLGTAYQIFGDEKYAVYAKKIFLEYAKQYPTWGEHPVNKSYATGKLFWQQLNEAVWLVDAIQGYDAIVSYLTPDERKNIEQNLLIPFANFLSIENPKVFNRIHNHGVWAVAAVGMTGIALNNNELICRALYGIDKKGKPNYNKIDINKLEAFNSGFFVQTKTLFSPDGYYTEGPYYQRYAMTPFLLFAQSIQNNIPELKVLEYRNQVFFKAVETLIDLTNTKGVFLPINDNLKGMSLNTPALVWGVDFLYANTHNPELLSIAHNHSFSLINSLGLEVVKGLSNNLQKPLKQQSRLITDGSNGDLGGIMLLRDSVNEFCAVFKFASQGLTHGHYDRLNLFLNNSADEVLTDYGAARFVNFMAKDGGRYLHENESYALQTVAHNTLVVNEQSQFNFDYKVAELYHPEFIFGDISNTGFQIACARDTTAYKGVEMTRVVGLLDDEAFINPILIDVYDVVSNSTAKYDMPFHYLGQLIDTDFEYTAHSTNLKPLGSVNGYEHLWLIADGKTTKPNASITWLHNYKMYSLTTVSNSSSELLLTQIGAADPKFNLRNEPAFIIRQPEAKNHTFVSILECHGTQDPNTEIVANQTKNIKEIKVLDAPDSYLAISFTTVNGNEFMLVVCIDITENNKNHSIQIGEKTLNWNGQFKLFKN